MHLITADSSVNERWWKKVRETVMGAFLPIPKKGTHGQIFAIVQNEGKRPERL